jgi:hypothetical protein
MAAAAGGSSQQQGTPQQQQQQPGGDGKTPACSSPWTPRSSAGSQAVMQPLQVIGMSATLPNVDQVIDT